MIKRFGLGFLISAVYWPGMLSAAFVPRWAVLALGVPLLFELDLRKLQGPVRWSLGFFVAVCALSVLWTPDRMTGIYELLFVLILCIVTLAGSGLDRLDDIMRGMAVGLVPSALLVVPQYLGRPVVQMMSMQPSGLFANAEVLAEFSALLFVWGVVKRDWVVVIPTILPLALCESRIAILAIIIGLLWVFRPSSKAVFTGLLFAIACAGIGALLFFGVAKLISAGHRITIWLATMYALEPFGNGLGWFQIAHPHERYAHSDILQIIVEIGVLALPLVIVPILALKEKTDVAAQAVFVAVGIECLVSFPLHMPATGFLAALVAGHLLRDRSMVRARDTFSRMEDVSGLQRTVLSGGLSPAGIRRLGFAVSVRQILTRCKGSRPAQLISHGVA